MSEQEKHTPDTPESRSSSGDIDWTQYGRQAAEILRGTQGAEAPSQPSAWREDPPAPEEPEEAYDEPEEYEEEYEEEPPQQAQPSHRRPLTPPEPVAPPEPPRPRRHRKVRSLSVTFLVAMLYVVSVLAISFVMATLGWRWANDLLALNKDYYEASVVVEAGDTLEEVAQQLQENGLIEYPILFEIFASITGKGENISSGTYTLTTNMDYSALLNSISASSSTRETVTVTIPEGYTVQEIFELLESQGANTVEELEDAALNEEYEYSFLEGLEQDDPYWMEGYLFPDTYEFYKDGDAKLVLSKMLYNYYEKFTSEMQTRAERLGYTQHEIMIIASIIEKETDGSDQADIASVIYNRLEPDNTETLGKLQMDSTIQYILDERKETLTEEDLAIDSPYNTYLYEGLPAGTICNPGMEAIEAALYPSSTDYYYFILGDDGVTHFFSSYSDFNNYRSGITVEETEETTDEETADEGTDTETE